MSAPPLVIAHRGASGYRPEHTASAYRMALAMGADAIEPDLVASRDGVLVVRHENEISGTTDVASRPEFASRRTRKVIDGVRHTGWFTEDFTWAELATLRARERLPSIRPRNTAFDGAEGLLRLSDVIALAEQSDRPVVVVAELKHPTYFASLGLPLDELFAQEVGGWATDANLVVECFEEDVLAGVRARGVPGRRVFLVEAQGAPADHVARFGSAARTFASYLTDEGLAGLAGTVDVVSVNKGLLLQEDRRGNVTGTTDLVERASAAGLETFVWTLRAENAFLGRNLRRGREPSDYGDWMAEYRLIFGTGVAGAFCDHPDLGIQARDSL
ncbi:glycerophosphodiester phosphodiesterase family protein [Naasia sp. SYSU D00948]|uniref:glycerophosphodiester phosphodiesterase family protein n=1 Tax=Naasia sp. SYSU D00948 TaxID=2817379 RepID=UPI0027DB468F|nr:glycerophosphodiester phosphodiesterase family protein [Naasia sp. SYSU D00948]